MSGFKKYGRWYPVQKDRHCLVFIPATIITTTTATLDYYSYGTLGSTKNLHVYDDLVLYTQFVLQSRHIPVLFIGSPHGSVRSFCKCNKENDLWSLHHLR